MLHRACARAAIGILLALGCHVQVPIVNNPTQDSSYQFRAMGFPYRDAFVFFPACSPSRVASLTIQDATCECNMRPHMDPRIKTG
jgi:hypothetical protein